MHVEPPEKCTISSESKKQSGCISFTTCMMTWRWQEPCSGSMKNVYTVHGKSMCEESTISRVEKCSDYSFNKLYNKRVCSLGYVSSRVLAWTWIEANCADGCRRERPEYIRVSLWIHSRQSKPTTYQSWCWIGYPNPKQFLSFRWTKALMPAHCSAHKHLPPRPTPQWKQLLDAFDGASPHGKKGSLG